MRTRKILKSSLRKTLTTTTAATRRRRTAAETLRRRRRRRRAAHARACCSAGERKRSSSSSSFSSSTAAAKFVNSRKVSDKLEALKNLIPSSHFNHGRVCEEDGDDDQTVKKTEQLFQETADYIILLRTQVVVLQRLIEFYGSADTSRENGIDNPVNVLL